MYIVVVKQSFRPSKKKYIMQKKKELSFDLLTNPKEILVDENGWVKGMKVIKMELGEPDASEEDVR